MKKQDISERFIEIYNELDSYMRKTLKYEENTDHSFLISEMARRGNRAFEQYAYELRLFARLRNAIIHNPYKKTSNPIAEPHRHILEKYVAIKNFVINPPRALSVAVPGLKIFTATLSSNVQEIMNVMVEKAYTHIPIITGGKMIGIFSENVLLCYMVDNKDCLIMKDATIGDFKKYIPVSKHMNEYFEFVPRNTQLYEIDKIFNTGLKRGKRIAVVYITEHGDPEEKLLGMITPWDLTNRPVPLS